MPDTTPAPFRPEVVEVHSLGSSAVLHNPASGAVAAVPGAAGETGAVGRALAALAAGEPPGPLADAVADWQAAGLFDESAPPHRQPVAWRAPRAATEARFALGDRAVLVRSEPVELADHLIAGLSRVTDHGNAPVDAVVDVIDTGAGYGVFRDRVPAWGLAPFDLSRFHALRETMVGLLGPARVGATLHGAAVARNGQAILVLGASGAGKTTLSLGLVGRGCAQAADDHVALAADGPAIFSFPAASAMKPGAAPRHLEHLLDLPAARRGDERLVTVDAVAPGLRLPVAGIVFPDYAPDGPNSMTRVPPEEALWRVIHTGGRPMPGGSLGPLVGLLDAVPCVALRFASTDFSLDRVEALWP